MPEPYYSDELVTLYHAKCEEYLPSLPDEAAMLVLTDPPYRHRQGRLGRQLPPWLDG